MSGDGGPPTRRLGVLGTLVRDTIHGRGGPDGGPVEEWGGICYALSAFEAAGPPGWSLLPIVKVGADVREEAGALLDGLDRVDSTRAVRVVDAPNNRVELRYRDAERRTERLRGGVPGWSREELAPLAASCDALYVNFIAGWELDLDGARALRAIVPGPLYADLHSLFLDVGPDGLRRPRELEDGPEWVSSFDLVQMNGDELGRLAPAGEGDPWRVARRLAGSGGARALFVTLGSDGARWVPPEPDLAGLALAAGAPGARPASDAAVRTGDGEVGASPSGVRYGREPAPAVDDPDPTGCGDVWGITCFSSLLAGSGVRDAVRRANRVAALNARERGGRALARRHQGGPIREV